MISVGEGGQRMDQENLKDELKKAKRDAGTWQLFTGVLFLLLVGSVLTHGYDFSSGDAATQPTTSSNTIEVIGDIELANAKIRGEIEAPITILEYSDFECPFCKRHYSETYPLIEKEYIDTGLVRYVFKHYPLSFHPQAVPAAIASECANLQGRFWDYHDVLFEEGVQGGNEAYKTYAKSIGLTESTFKDCIEKETFSEIIGFETNEGKKIGIKGTPGFVIMNTDESGEKVMISGAQPYSVFKQAIDEALQKVE